MREPLKLVKTGYTREQVLEMLRKGELEPTRKALEEIGRSEQQAKTDLKNYRKNTKSKSAPDYVEPAKRAVIEHNSGEAAPQPKRIEAGPPQEPIKEKTPWPVTLPGTAAQIIGLMFGVVGFTINCRFNSSLGQTQLYSWLFGLFGAAVDLTTIFGLAFAAGLWRRNCKGMAIITCLLWLVAIALSTYTTISFAANNLDDGWNGRSKIADKSTSLTAQLATAKNALWALPESRDRRELAGKIQEARGRVPASYLRSSNDCTNVTTSWDACRELKAWHDIQDNEERLAGERRDLKAEIDKLQSQIDALPPVATRNPGAEHFSRLSLGTLQPNQIENAQINVIALMINLGAGILFGISGALNRIA